MERLQAALGREMQARDYYQAAATAFPRPRRFANIARAEQHHADAIAGAIEQLGGEPALRPAQAIAAPKTVAEAQEAGRRIELAVIELYKDLLGDCKDPAVRSILEHIQAANHRHLSAFGG